MTSLNTYNVGDLVVMTGTFADPLQSVPPIDPVTGHTLVNPPGPVTCTVRKGDGITEVTPAVTINGTTYTATITVDQPGIWWYRFTAPGPSYQGVGEQSFGVVPKRA